MPGGRKKKKNRAFKELHHELERGRQEAIKQLIEDQRKRPVRVAEVPIDTSGQIRARAVRVREDAEEKKMLMAREKQRLKGLFGSSPTLSSEAPLGVLSTSSPMRPSRPRRIIEDYIFKDDSPVAEGDKILPRIPSPYRHMKQVPLMIARQQKRKTRARMKKKKHQKQTKKKKKKKKNTKKKKK
jgi:hypothetical protein